MFKIPFVATLAAFLSSYPTDVQAIEMALLQTYKENSNAGCDGKDESKTMLMFLCKRLAEMLSWVKSTSSI